MLNFFKILPSSSDPSQRPNLACEIMPEGVTVAAQTKPGEAATVSFSPLSDGALTPGLQSPNFTDEKAVEAALNRALIDVSSKLRQATLVIPDAASRVLILDFDSLPEKKEDALPILRFRLKKLLPFEVEASTVSYQIMSRSPESVKTLVAVVPNDVLQEYEGALRKLGYEAGAVLTSTLAAAASLSSLESALIVNNSGHSITTAIVNGEELLLHRTIDLPQEEHSALDEIQRSVEVTMAYFEDTLHAPPSKLLCTGFSGIARLEKLLGGDPVAVADLVPLPTTGYSTALPRGVLAGVTGALAR